MAFHREEPGDFQSSKGSSTSTEGGDILELGHSRWNGSGMLAFEKFFALMEGRLPGKMFLEAVKYQMKREVVRKNSYSIFGFQGGQLAAIGLEFEALIAAKQGLKVT
ncbi:Hypothetical predicted protein [Olea europaea subsp. europaea]|uniref:Uncharacterized protein n=1 Tax=Olea europaea subsp. europaea TaxID=158383 RepID=A0A8S0TCN8_OLEEU|nr:Hypothetical predicted protein [Olea europaea subsp. europaea]